LEHQPVFSIFFFRAAGLHKLTYFQASAKLGDGSTEVPVAGLRGGREGRRVRRWEGGREGGKEGRRGTYLGDLDVELRAVLRDGATQQLAEVFVGEKVGIDEEGSGAEVELKGLDCLAEVGAHCVEKGKKGCVRRR